MDFPKDKRFKDITGQKFTRLTAVSYEGPAPGRQKLWRCRCDCGKEVVARSGSLIFGSVRSCGCLKSEVTAKRNFRHDLRRHPLYPTWNNMMHRCSNPKSGEWKNYGERGIKVCNRWHSFKSFAADMPPRPSANHSIERREMNGDYTPKNCYWATPLQQSNNKRDNHTLLFNGERHTIAEWSRKLGINHELIRGRVRHGWSDEEALTTPSQRR